MGKMMDLVDAHSVLVNETYGLRFVALPNDRVREAVAFELTWRQGRLAALASLPVEVVAGLDDDDIRLEIEYALGATDAARGLAQAWADGGDWRRTDAARYFLGDED